MEKAEDPTMSVTRLVSILALSAVLTAGVVVWL